MGERDVLTDAEQASLSLVRSWRDEVNATAGQCDTPRINELLIRELEQLKHAISARQIELTTAAVEASRDRLAATGQSAKYATSTTGLAVAIARRRHPMAGHRLVHQADVLTRDLPHVLAAMRAGELGETQAAILVRETDGLTPAQRAQVTEEISEKFRQLGDRGLGEAARAAAGRIAPDAIAARHAKAVADRHVTYRSAPDAMLRLSALLPLRDGLACVQALQAAADAAAPSATGTTRQRWRQAQADALVKRITAAAIEPPTAVSVNLLIPLDTLIGDGAAHLDGYGTIPGRLARELIDGCSDEAGPLIRRVFTAPGSGELISMESRARHYPGLLKDFIRYRDQRCRTRYCESPIRHIDHITPAADGGATSDINGRGTCERCNYDKELPGVSVTGTAAHTRHTIGSVTAHGAPPPPPGGRPAPSPPDATRDERRAVIRAMGYKIISLQDLAAGRLWDGHTPPQRE